MMHPNPEARGIFFSFKNWCRKVKQFLHTLMRSLGSGGGETLCCLIVAEMWIRINENTAFELMFKEKCVILASMSS